MFLEGFPDFLRTACKHGWQPYDYSKTRSILDFTLHSCHSQELHELYRISIHLLVHEGITPNLDYDEILGVVHWFQPRLLGSS